MPYTYPPQWYEDPVPEGSSLIEPMRSWLWFLNGTHSSQASTVPWACVECWDGSTREVPPSGSMANLDSGNRWHPDTVTAALSGMWATFQAPSGGDVVNRFQIYYRLISQPTIRFCFLDDWSIGGGTDTSPTLPAASFENVIRFQAGDWTFTGLVDEGTALLVVYFTASDRQWVYMGDLVPINPVSLDPRPFTFSRDSGNPGWRPGAGADYRCISAVDDSTIITGNPDIAMGAPMDTTNDEDAFATRPICDVNGHTTTASHRYRVGEFRNLGAMNKHADSQTNSDRNSAGYDGSDNRFEHFNRTNDNARVVMLNIPAAAYDVHTTVYEESVPSTLIPSTGGDETPPVVTYVTPQPNVPIRSNSQITIDVTDDSGDFAGIQLRVKFPTARPKRPTETIHGGDTTGVFEPFYENCEVIPITDGFRFVLSRTGGWPASPTFTASPVDSSGNVIAS